MLELLDIQHLLANDSKITDPFFPPENSRSFTEKCGLKELNSIPGAVLETRLRVTSIVKEESKTIRFSKQNLKCIQG